MKRKSKSDETRQDWDVSARGPLNCTVEFRVLSGANLATLKHMFTRAQRREYCLTADGRGVGEGYVHTAFGKRQSRFAVVATAPHRNYDDRRRVRGTADKLPIKGMGFALCTTYNSYGGGGGGAKSQLPVAQRVVMLDLLCSGPCRGLNQALVRAVADVARDKYKATVLMLEAATHAATFYERFGFRRVPNACDWPSHDVFQRAKRAFEGRTWRQPDDPTWKRPSVRQVAATVNKGVAPVWWPGYNREDNGTVIMSLCLGKPLPYAAPGLVNWTNRTAAQLMADDTRTSMAPTHNANFTLDGSKYVRLARRKGPSTPPPAQNRRVTRSQSPDAAAPKHAAMAVATAAAQRIPRFKMPRRSRLGQKGIAY